MKEVDFLIVGQGLAGTVLGYLLEKNGKTIAIIDNGHSSSASKIAAGMWNPVGFKTMGKTWEADTFLPVAMRLYAEMEKAVDADFLHPMDIVRIHTDAAEKAKWEKTRLSNHYLQEETPDPEGVIAAHGTGRVSGAGWLDLPTMLDAFAKHWHQQGKLIQTEVHDADIRMDQERVVVGQISARKIVLCRGFKEMDGSFFQKMPMMATKGEVLTGRHPHLPQNVMLNNGKFCLPIGNGHFRMGSTYGWSQTDPAPTAAGKAEIMERIEKLSTQPMEITDHVAGIRPTVRDRRPLIGTHPNEPRLCLFNGLGTRGVLIAPAMAINLTEHLLHAKPLSPEADLTRFVNEKST